MEYIPLFDMSSLACGFFLLFLLVFLLVFLLLSLSDFAVLFLLFLLFWLPFQVATSTLVSLTGFI